MPEICNDPKLCLGHMEKSLILHFSPQLGRRRSLLELKGLSRDDKSILVPQNSKFLTTIHLKPEVLDEHTCYS